MLKLLQQLPIQAVIFEDVRGTHFPFQNAELVRLIRKYVAPPRLVLVHSHSGNGMEDAAAIDAILAGADGIWAGLSPHAAQGAHSSGAMLICNLLRAGNEQVKETYEFNKAVSDRRKNVSAAHGRTLARGLSRVRQTVVSLC